MQECAELKNIKYKTMLLNRNSLKTNSHSNSEKVNDFLVKESVLNEKVSWVKLDKTIKISKITTYVKLLGNKYNLTKSEIDQTNKYILVNLNRKKLYKVKDVEYDSEKGVILNIPTLIFNKENRRFTLKKSEKRISTLKSLAPRKRLSKTQKNLEKIDTHIKD
jgi:hypothetical protein